MLNNRIRTLTILSFYFFVNSESYAGNSFESVLEPIIRDVIKQQGIPGLAIAVVEDGNIIYENSIDINNIKNPTGKISDNSLFHMASVTKIFVATAVMQLAEQNKINLDSHVVKYLPHFRMKEGKYNEITIRQMLSHTAGMPDERDYGWDNPQYDDGALERYVLSL